MTQKEIEQLKWILFDRNLNPISEGQKLGFKNPRKLYQIAYNGRATTPNDRKKIIEHFGIVPDEPRNGIIFCCNRGQTGRIERE